MKNYLITGIYTITLLLVVLFTTIGITCVFDFGIKDQPEEVEDYISIHATSSRPTGIYYQDQIDEIKQALNNHLKPLPEKTTYQHTDGYEVEYVSDVWSEDFGKWCGWHIGYYQGCVYKNEILEHCFDEYFCFTKEEIDNQLKPKFK